MSRRRLRLILVAVLCLSAAVVVQGATTAPRDGTASDVPEAPPREHSTVATESARYGTIMAWHPNGSRRYYADEYTKYFDVDPVPGASATVEYTATETIHTAGPTCREPPCARNVVERANLTTGETEIVYERYDADETAAEWHDHVRINSSHIVVADMIADQVFLVNTTTGMTEWLWDAQNAYPLTSGGPYPHDWTHLNDVEQLADGRIMVSLRNQDQVVFIDLDTGLQSNWTLGRDDDHDTLYEQHNPEFIPADRGGPAVLVADSENSRVVEYQRHNGTWNRTWTWTDGRMQWPRDADRLPNGNTLVADTHGGRLLEIAPDGTVVWRVALAHPYDVERLGTGEGPSAARANLTSRTGGAPAADRSDGEAKRDRDAVVAVAKLLRQIVPPRLLNALYYVAPVWMGIVEGVAALVGLVAALCWALLELRWRLPPLGLRLPVYRKRAGERAGGGSKRRGPRETDGEQAADGGSDDRGP